MCRLGDGHLEDNATYIQLIAVVHVVPPGRPSSQILIQVPHGRPTDLHAVQMSAIATAGSTGDTKSLQREVPPFFCYLAKNQLREDTVYSPELP